MNGRHFSTIKREAKLRGYDFLVTAKTIYNLYETQNERCALTDLPISFASIGERNLGLKKTASLDRIDNNKGYIEENIWWLHKDVNIMKHAHSTGTFLRYILLIALNWLRKSRHSFVGTCSCCGAENWPVEDLENEGGLEAIFIEDHRKLQEAA